MYIHEYIYIDVSIYIITHIHMCICAYVHMYIIYVLCIYIYLCLYIYMCVSSAPSKRSMHLVPSRIMSFRIISFSCSWFRLLSKYKHMFFVWLRIGSCWRVSLSISAMFLLPLRAVCCRFDWFGAVLITIAQRFVSLHIGHMQYTSGTMHYALCTMHYALWTMHFALCTLH